MKRASILLALFLTPSYAFGQASQTGFPPYGSFSSPSFGTVNLQNLNYYFTIPLGSSPGRAMNLNFGVSYNSLIWQNNSVAWVPVVDPNGNPTWGWTLASPIGTIPYQYTTTTCFTVPGGHPQTTQSYSSYQYVEPNGTRHSFGVSYTFIPSGCPGAGTYGSNTGYASDNSGFFINITNHTGPVVYSPGGTQITNTSLTDTNGNSMSATLVNSSETDWKDTAGRIALKVITGSSSIQYQFLDPTGNYQTITVTLSSQNIKTNFGCSGVAEYTGTALLPSQIQLPNSQSYTAYYETTPGSTGYVTGRLASIMLPPSTAK